MVNDTGTFIVSSVFMDSTPTAYLKWGINKFKITFPTLCYSHQDPGPASDPPATSPYINLNLLQHFLSTLKLPGMSPSPAISRGSTELIMEDIYSMFREEIDLYLKLCRLNTGDKASLPPYLRRLTVKHVSEIIRYQIITIQVRNTE